MCSIKAVVMIAVLCAGTRWGARKYCQGSRQCLKVGSWKVGAGLGSTRMVSAAAASVESKTADATATEGDFLIWQLFYIDFLCSESRIKRSGIGVWSRSVSDV